MLQDSTRRWFFPYLIRKFNLKVGVEIGVLYGDFSFCLCGELDKLYLVDSWTRKHKDNSPEQQKERVRRKLSGHSNYEILHSTSKDAASRFDDGFFDFVYIDAAHDFDSALEDIALWFPKLKNNGVLAGHDYNLEAVKRAVDSYSFSNLSVLHGDKSESWWVIKNSPLTLDRP